jgi:hypothetical protein
MAEIKNSSARIWTKEQLKYTLSECKENNFTIQKDDFLTTVYDNETIVLTSAIFNNRCLVRINNSYFN